MKNKQTIFTVLALAVVASLLTLAAKTRPSFMNHNGVMPFFDDGYEQNVEIDNVGADYADSVRRAPVDGSVTKTNEKMMVGMPAPMPPYYDNEALNVQDRVYQKSSYHSVVVDDVSSYLRSVKEYVLSIDGRVLNSSVASGEKYDNGSLYVKVPVAKFDEATSRVTENVDKIVNENINSSDITGQLVNTTENLQSLKDQKSLKEAALKDAKTEVEKRRYKIEIERLERQIVSAEKSVNNVETKVEYSAISVTAANSERYFNPSADLSIHEEFLKAWESLKEVLKVGVYFGVWVLVYSVVLLPLTLIVKMLVNKLRN